jgi:ubiquinone/menaquinone biosynthesis C-methylase UbiE
MIHRFIAGKFRRPVGLFGRLVGNVMARSNEYEAGWTVSLLSIQPEDHVLELGFGPGVAIQRASQEAVRGVVAGIDYSETMVRVARRRNAAAVKSGRVTLRQGEGAALPYPDESFDKALSIHCVYFWPLPVDTMKELWRTLKPGGSLAVTILPREKWPKSRTPPDDIFTLYDVSEVSQIFLYAGFPNVRIELCPRPDKFPGACVIGVK